MNYDLAGKVALVTGGASGIGEAVVAMLLDSGASVVIADINGERAKQIASKSKKRQAIGIAVDVKMEAAVIEAIAAAKSSFGRLDMLVCAAGILETAQPLDRLELATWDSVLSVNLTGVFLAMKHSVPIMLENGGGTIVNVASIGGVVGVPQQAAYIASKFGVMGITKVAALEYATQGIRVNAVLPGITLTPILESRIAGHPDREAALASNLPINRLAAPTEIAAAILWLCSDASSYVTGAGLTADGGYTAR